MNDRIVVTSRWAVLLVAAVLASACGDSSGGHRSQPGDPESTAVRGHMLSRARSRISDSIAVERSGFITEREIAALLAHESELYWGIRGLATAERRTTGDGVLLALDTAKIATMKDVRSWFEPVYTTTAIDTLLTEFGVVARDGRIWIPEADGGDRSEYERSKLLEVEPDGAEHVIAVVLVPLGDTGEAETRWVRLKRTPAGWRIESAQTRQ